MGFRKQLERDIESTLLQEVLVGVLLGLPDEAAMRAVQDDLEHNVIENYPDGHPALPKIKPVVDGIFFNARLHAQAARCLANLGADGHDGADGDDGDDDDCPICAATGGPDPDV